MDATFGKKIEHSDTELTKPKEFIISTEILSAEGLDKRLIEITNRNDEVADQVAGIIERRGWKTSQSRDMGAWPPIKDALDNSVFHGNFDVPSKSDQDTLMSMVTDRILERLQKGGNIPSQVKVTVEEQPSQIIISIEDQGRGFDWHKVKDPLTPESIMHANGRGIFMVFYAFGLENVDFNEKGNKLVITAKLNQNPR